MLLVATAIRFCSIRRGFRKDGAEFGTVCLIMMVIAMFLQTGHVIKQVQSEIWEERAECMMATLGSTIYL